VTFEAGPRLEVTADAETAAVRAAEIVAAELNRAIAARGRATIALSGGRTPLRMFYELATLDLPWERLDVFQVDERVAPAGDVERNRTTIERALAEQVVAHRERFHWMPVEDADLTASAQRYARELAAAVGTAGALDVVHLGIGADGHTASLFPGSPLLGETAADVALAPPHAGRQRMTLTFPALNRARCVVWLVTGGDKKNVLAQLIAADPDLVATRVRRGAARVVADEGAAANCSGRLVADASSLRAV
jgi:6-phosphogluconolactonase